MQSAEYNFISEKNFEKDMEAIAEPSLAGLRRDKFFISFDGTKIHFEEYLVKNARASLVLAHGFCEAAEKYRELSYYFINMGFNVFVPDQRGFGRSQGHSKNPSAVRINSFDSYIKDLKILVDTQVRPASGELPLYFFGHSMGGAVGVQFLQTYPEIFKKAVLSSPMIKAKTAGIPDSAARAVTGALIFLGFGDRKLPGFGGFNPERSYLQSHDTSEERFSYYQKKRIENSCLQTSAPTARWVNEAIKVSRLNLSPERCAGIKADIFLCKPESDSAVVPEAEDEFFLLAPHARLRVFKNCRHEIYNSTDETLKEYIAEIEDFFDGRNAV